jgi:bla regulator protein blaR1
VTTLITGTAVTDTAGWTLIHFLWQGTALALMLYVFIGLTKRPALRYGAGVITLVAMTASPLITFFLLLARHRVENGPSKLQLALSSFGVVSGRGADIPLAKVTQSLSSIDWLTCFVWVWLAGVTVFALRAFGGYLLLRRIVRDKCEPLAFEFLERCEQLQKRLALSTTIRYVQSRVVQAPAVVGWFRPVVLIPLSTLTGLSWQQVEAVIAHELAHIKRFDCFVNLFQVAIESILFYHPAVWWVSRFIRNERENCCDDAAVRACGDPGDYARALAFLESGRTAPSLVLAANSGNLKRRVSRILGFETVRQQGIAQGGLALIGTLCIAGALFGAATLREAFAKPAQTQPVLAEPPVAAPIPEPALAASPPAAPKVPTAPKFERSMAGALAPVPPLPPAYVADDEPAATDASKESYIDGLREAGLTNLDVNCLIQMKIQGVTPEYVKQMRAAGVNASPSELVAMKIQGISPDYVTKTRAAGWGDASVGQLIAMKVQGVDPEQAAEFKREFGAQSLSLGQIIAFKVQGVTPDYVRALRAAGFRDLSSGQVLAAKIQGITPGFLQKVRDHGFHDLSLHQLIGLKIAGVF